MLTEKQFDQMEKTLLRWIEEDREYHRESRRRFEEQIKRLRNVQKRSTTGGRASGVRRTKPRKDDPLT